MAEKLSAKDLTGKVVGRLTVLGRAAPGKHTRGYAIPRWECICTCGNLTTVIYSNLFPESKTPPTKSCGCLQRDSAKERKGRTDYHGKSYDYVYQAWTHAKRNAKVKGREFNIEVHDLTLPATCPLLGIPLLPFSGRLQEGSPSVDRIDPTKGYVKGNVWIISNKANRIKSNASLEELELLVENLRAKIEEGAS